MSNAFTDFVSWSSTRPTEPAVATAGAHTSRAGTGITQTLLDMIDAQQPVTTTQLSEQAGIRTKIVWGLMKNQQERDLGHKLARLQAIEDEVRRHAHDVITSRIRLQDARNRYHALHQVITTAYGRQNAPALDAAIHGPRPNSTERKTSERTE